MGNLSGGRMKKILILVICTLFLASLVYGQVGDVEVTRELPDSVQPNQNVEVKLNIKLTGEAPSGLILEEELPEGWEIVDDAGGVLRKGKFAFLLYGGDVQEKTITYTLKSPADLTQDSSIMGAWQTLLTGGMIEGDILLVAGEPTGADSTLIMIIIGAVVVVALIAIFLKKKKK